MRKAKFLILISFFLCLLLPFNAYAKTHEEITTSRIEKNKITSDYSVTLLKTEPEKYTIDCFDVNYNNNIALVTEKSSNFYLSVYDKDFKFQYAFSFTANSVNVEWNYDNITIYYHRDNVAVTYNNLGEIITISHFEPTTENSINFSNMDKPYRNVGKTEYKLQNKFGILNLLVGESSYSQLVKVDVQGNETLLYNVNSQQLLKTILILFFFIGLFIIAFIKIKPHFKKYKNKDISNVS